MTMTILVVDDERDNVELVRKLLEYEGYRVIDAYDGDEAIEKALEEKPDLILLDVMMPKKNGLVVCNELKERPATKHIPILLLTSKRDVTSMVSGLDIGADDYITKPFNFRELLARIRAHLRNHVQILKCKKDLQEVDPVKHALDLVKEAQSRSRSIFTNAMAEEVMMFELADIDDFNKFSLEIKSIENVSIKDVKVFENKYIIKLSVFPPAFNKIT